MHVYMYMYFIIMHVYVYNVYMYMYVAVHVCLSGLLCFLCHAVDQLSHALVYWVDVSGPYLSSTTVVSVCARTRAI